MRECVSDYINFRENKAQVWMLYWPSYGWYQNSWSCGLTSLLWNNSLISELCSTSPVIG